MSDAQLKTLLNATLDHIADFVAANSLIHVTNVQIEDRMKADATKLCERADDFRLMIEAYKSISPEEFRRSIDELLSVPRPPVMNPCL